MSGSLPIATIKKNSREEIRLSLDMFNGHRLFNMRVFFEAEDGSMRPGKSGLAFKVNKLEVCRRSRDERAHAGQVEGLPEMSAEPEVVLMLETGFEPEPVVIDTARWIVLGERDKSKSLIPQLREQFGLSLKQAAAACREASLIRARAH